MSPVHVQNPHEGAYTHEKFIKNEEKVFKDTANSKKLEAWNSTCFSLLELSKRRTLGEVSFIEDATPFWLDSASVINFVGRDFNTIT